MSRTIVIANQKGGVAKTTTTINLAMGLGAAEKNTLIIDLDPQANATSGLGINPDNAEYSVYDLIVGDTHPSELVISNIFPFVNLLPSKHGLAGAEIEMVSMVGRETLLRDRLQSIRDTYDYIIIDCPPSLGLLTLNGLVAADSVIIPIQSEYFALEGVGALMETLNLVRARLNPELEIEGVLLTMFDSRTNLSNQVAEEIKKYFGEKVYKSIIPRNVRLSESPSFGLPILLYDATSAGARAYMNLAAEVLNYGSKKSSG